MTVLLHFWYIYGVNVACIISVKLSTWNSECRRQAKNCNR